MKKLTPVKYNSRLFHPIAVMGTPAPCPSCGHWLVGDVEVSLVVLPRDVPPMIMRKLRDFHHTQKKCDEALALDMAETMGSRL